MQYLLGCQTYLDPMSGRPASQGLCVKDSGTLLNCERLDTTNLVQTTPSNVVNGSVRHKYNTGREWASGEWATARLQALEVEGPLDPTRRRLAKSSSRSS